MRNLKRDMIRKVEARKIALLASADSKVNNRTTVEENSTDFEKRYWTLVENIRYAAENSNLSIYKYLNGNKIEVFVKKCIRKIIMKTCGWLINPLIEQQNAFNGKVINALCDIKDILAEEEQRSRNTQYQVEKINCTVDPKVPNDIEAIRKKLQYLSEKLNISYEPQDVEGIEIDYIDFEDRFRGPRENVKKLQSYYLEYFKLGFQTGYVLDIGCGRGEFLELLKENGVVAKGIDCYLPFVNYCESKGYDVECADALKYLERVEDESLNGIFMGQVVEHLNPDYFRKLLKVAYSKLKTGAYFLVETQNPESLTMYLGFYSDPTHIKPVPYQELEYFFQYYHYKDVRCFHNQETEYEHKIPYIQSESIDNLKEINFAIEVLNLVLFGARDYTLIARK